MDNSGGEGFHCLITSFMVETIQELFSTKKDLHSSTDNMRRDVASVYDRLTAQEAECFREASPLRHRVLELEMQEELLRVVCDDRVNCERKIRSRLFELSSELYELQRGRDFQTCDFGTLERQQREIDFRVAAINVLRDHIYASKTNKECARINNLLSSLDESGKILQVEHDARQINELRDRTSHVHVMHRVAVTHQAACIQ